MLPEEASDLGQHSIEHLGGRFWGLLVGSSKDEVAIHAEELPLSEFSVVCHERVRSSEHDAVSEMEVGPSESAYRGWLQTAVCC